MNDKTEPDTWRLGTHYACGCWYGGSISEHPEKCRAHGIKWRYQFYLDKDGTRMTKERSADGN